MNFESLANFDWYNEPENVRFETDSMVIYAKPQTDFWQSVQHGFKKDNGHFFFSRKDGDFSFIVRWRFDRLDKFAQCGVMLRTDERNWLKASLMNETEGENVLAVCLTVAGHSDWSGFLLNEEIHEMWFKLQRHEDDYILFYSLDGKQFTKIKMFYLKSYEDVKAGAYIASPSDEGAVAELCAAEFL